MPGLDHLRCLSSPDLICSLIGSGASVGADEAKTLVAAVDNWQVLVCRQFQDHGLKSLAAKDETFLVRHLCLCKCHHALGHCGKGSGTDYGRLDKVSARDMLWGRYRISHVTGSLFESECNRRRIPGNMQVTF